MNINKNLFKNCPHAYFMMAKPKSMGYATLEDAVWLLDHWYGYVDTDEYGPFPSLVWDIWGQMWFDASEITKLYNEKQKSALQIEADDPMCFYCCMVDFSTRRLYLFNMDLDRIMEKAILPKDVMQVLSPFNEKLHASSNTDTTNYEVDDIPVELQDSLRQYDYLVLLEGMIKSPTPLVIKGHEFTIDECIRMLGVYILDPVFNKVVSEGMFHAAYDRGEVSFNLIYRFIEKNS